MIGIDNILPHISHPELLYQPERKKDKHGINKRKADPPDEFNDGCNCCPYPNGKMNGSIENTRSGPSIMLSHEDAHSLVKHPNIIQAATPCAFTFEVNDGGFSKIKIPESQF